MASNSHRKSTLTTFGIIFLLSPLVANQMPNGALDKPLQRESLRNIQIEETAELPRVALSETLRQSALILSHNYVDEKRLESSEIINAGLQALANTFPQLVEFAAPNKSVGYLTSKHHATLCGSSQTRSMHFCEASQQKKRTGLAAKPLRGPALLRIGQRVFVLPENANDLTQLSQKQPEIAKILNEIVNTTRQKENIIDHVFLNGVLAALDPHTAFLNSEEYRELKNGTHGQFGGVGIVLRGGANLPVVDEIIPGSSADRSGILTGDIIIRVNDSPTIFMPVEQVAQRLRTLTSSGDANAWIYRPNSETVFTAKLSREEFETRTVETSEIPGKPEVIYARITSFSDQTAEELHAILLARSAKDANKSLVLDMRGNPGGLLDEAVKVADLFLKSGTQIVAVRTRFETQRETSSFREKFDLPMAVLVDSGSASASEIVAGALRDHGRAVIVGERSFGKGSVQSLFETGDGSALKLTIAHYFTPGGHSIQGRGITPHLTTRALSRQNNVMWIAGTAEPERENELPFSLENPDNIPSPIADIDNEYESTIWTEKPTQEFAVGVPQAPLSPRKVPNWQNPRTVENDFSLRTAIAALGKIGKNSIVPNRLEATFVDAVQKNELQYLSPTARNIIKPDGALRRWKAEKISSLQSENDFEFNLVSSGDPIPTTVPVVLHLNGHSDGPTLIVTAERVKMRNNRATMRFRVPEIARAVRSIQFERNSTTAAVRPSLFHPEIPIGSISLQNDGESQTPEMPMITLLAERPCSHNRLQNCTPVRLSLPENSRAETSHFSLVPFLSRSKIPIPQGPITLVSNGLGFSTFEFEIMSEKNSAEKEKPTGIVAAVLQKNNGEIIGGWPILAVKDGAVERVNTQPPR